MQCCRDGTSAVKVPQPEFGLNEGSRWMRPSLSASCSLHASVRWLVVLVLLLSAAACGDTPPPAPPVASGPYRLDTGDQVRVIIYNQPTLSAAYNVSDNGTISFPMLGQIRARALSVQELQKAIYDGLNNGIFVNPGVSVEVSQYRPFFVVGEVNKPGQYAYSTNLNVLAAVAEAGGFTVRANPKGMTVLRTDNGTRKEWHADRLTDMQPGDVLVVPEQVF